MTLSSLYALNEVMDLADDLCFSLPASWNRLRPLLFRLSIGRDSDVFSGTGSRRFWAPRAKPMRRRFRKDSQYYVACRRKNLGLWVL